MLCRRHLQNLLREEAHLVVEDARVFILNVMKFLLTGIVLVFEHLFRSLHVRFIFVQYFLGLFVDVGLNFVSADTLGEPVRTK